MNFITENLGIIISSLFGVGGIWGYLFERNKNKAITKGVEADAEAKEIHNGGQIIDRYIAALDDLENRYEKKYLQITALYDSKVKVLEDEIRLHKRMNTALKKENTELKKKLKDANNRTK
jgi:hypothetical protein